MTTYFSQPTPAGLAELRNAVVEGTEVLFTHIAIGDGGGSQVDPTNRTSLVREVDRIKVASIRKHVAEPSWLIVEGAIPEDRGGYWVRELALIGGRAGGVVLSVSNYPAVERPAPGNGAASGMILRMVVAFSDAAVVSLSVEPQAYATQQAILDQIALHEAKANPHPMYLTKEDGDGRLAAAMASHLQANDPHPMYLTEAEGDGRYLVAATATRRGIVELATEAEAVAGTDVVRAVTPAGAAAVMATHTQAGDPHPMYLNNGRATLLLMAGMAEQFFMASM